ncbi:copper homeostasis protein cutC homolog [Orussus abietinus]|uniref:copper homeostasis protein cutC homolog n=1 Tax=Orussus abietinus TaxID=222816 RepID=UPI000625BFD2|nr:copper homeostasis protein cutC homolog [Orussus abietinus]
MEICIDSVDSARNAITGGAFRLECCAALSEGGLTPTPGMIKQIRKSSDVPMYAMIRSRTGNFVYSQEEMDVMLYDLKLLKELGVNGFVFGALTEDGEIATEPCREIISAASPLPVTFHRAFDETMNPLKSLNTVIDLGFERILTSGQKSSALEGLELIKQLIHQARGKIIIMPGAGITKDNILHIKTESSAKEFHTSARKREVTRDNSGKFKIGPDALITDESLVMEMTRIVKTCRKM